MRPVTDRLGDLLSDVAQLAKAKDVNSFIRQLGRQPRVCGVPQSAVLLAAYVLPICLVAGGFVVKATFLCVALAVLASGRCAVLRFEHERRNSIESLYRRGA